MKKRRRRPRRTRGRKIHLPKINVGVDESDAVNVTAGFASDFANQADLGFSGGAWNAERQDFVGRESVARNDASAVAAKDHRFRFLGKDSAARIRPEQNDIQLFCDASTASKSLHRMAGTRSAQREKPTTHIGRDALNLYAAET